MSKTIEELLALVEKTKAEPKRNRNKAKITQNMQSVKDFIDAYKIEPGLNKVPTFLILYYYKVVWKGNDPENSKAKRVIFFKELNKHGFTLYRTEKQRYYLLNDALVITDDLLERAEMYVRRKYEENPKKIFSSGE